MKKMLFAALCLAALALSARPVFAAPSDINIVDKTNFEKFDKRLNIYFSFNSEYNDYEVLKKEPEVLGWGINNNLGGIQEANLTLLTAERVAGVIPEKWSGPVTINVRHAARCSVYGNTFTEILKFENHEKKYDTLGHKDGINLRWETYDFIPGYPYGRLIPVLPDENLRYTDFPDKVLIIDSSGNFYAGDCVWDFVYYFDGREPYYTYRGYFSFDGSGTVVLEKKNFPINIYFIKFSTTQYEISVSADASMGNVTPEGPLKVNHGEDASFTITAKDGYRIAAVIADGERKSAANPFVSEYTFKNVTSNHSLEVLFADASDLPELSAAPGVTATVADYSDSRGEEAEALERGGFVSGDAAVKIAGDGTEMKEGTFCADEDGYVCTVKLSKECAEGAESGALTLTVKPKPGEAFVSGKSYYALVLNAKTNYYDVFPAKLSGAGCLEATLKPVGDYAALSTVFVYSGTASPGEEPSPPDEPGGGAGPKSSSGCNAGLGAIALLALVPLALRRKK